MEQKNEIIFPENSSDIISRLMEKYGLKETADDILEKIEKEEPTIGETLARLTVEVAEKKIPFKNISSNLEKLLNIPKKTADALAADIKTNILDSVQKIAIEEKATTVTEKEKVISSQETDVTEEEPEKKEEKIIKKDVYREPIE